MKIPKTNFLEASSRFVEVKVKDFDLMLQNFSSFLENVCSVTFQGKLRKKNKSYNEEKQTDVGGDMLLAGFSLTAE